MKLPQFEYYAPETLDETYSILQEYGDKARVLAGGTDLLVKMKQRAIKPLPKHVVNIKKVPGLDHIQIEDTGDLRIGALATIQEIKSVYPITERFPGLNQAVSILSTPQIRNIATIGGNLCNASPAAETAPVLCTLSANVKIIGKDRERIVPLEEFFLGPSKTVLQNDELLAEIQVPEPPAGSTSVYMKHGKRLSDIAIVGVAITLQMEGNKCIDAKIALASAGPTPMRVKGAEALMIGKEIDDKLIEEVGKKVSKESSPIDDTRAYADYRREKVGVLTQDAIKQAMQQIKLGGS